MKTYKWLRETVLNTIDHQGYKSEDDKEAPSHTVRMATIKNQRTSVGKDPGEREPLYAVGKNVNRCGHHGNHWRLLRKLNIELPSDPVVPTLGMYPEELKPGSSLQTHSQRPRQRNHLSARQ